MDVEKQDKQVARTKVENGSIRSETKLSNILNWYQNHPIFSIVIFIFLVVVGVEKFLGATDKIYKYIVGNDTQIQQQLSGYIRDQDNNPFSGVTVSISGLNLQKITDKHGSFAFEFEPTNHKSVELIAQKQGYETVSQFAFIGSRSLEIRMKPVNVVRTVISPIDSETIEGRLKLDISPPDAYVKFKSAGLKYSEGMRIKPGDYKIIISKKGYNSKEIDINIKPNETLTVRSNLDKKDILLEFLFKTKNERCAGTDDIITVIFSESDEEYSPNTQKYSQSINAQFIFQGFIKDETINFKRTIADEILIASKYIRIINSGENCWKPGRFSLKIDGKNTIDEIITPNKLTKKSNAECIQNYNPSKWSKRSYWLIELPQL